MALLRITSPHAHGRNRTQTVMLHVLIATLPAVCVLTWLFGWGTVINLIWASALALGFEAAILALRGRSLAFFLQDGSALVTAVLLALALPPFAPWWLTLIAVGFAIVFGKQLYGGLGQNPFNPAMLGYVVALISFPAAMTSWPAVREMAAMTQGAVQPTLGLVDAFIRIFAAGQGLPDAWAHATALDTLKINNSLTISELWATHPEFGWLGGRGVEAVNLAFLAGGLYLWARHIISWHAPGGMLLGLALMSLLFWNGGGSDSNGSPLFHLLTGATMLGAFFIVTDPVSGATSIKGRFIFGLGVGVLVYTIRTWGGYPDGVAFAVLLMNLAAPTIDYYTRPRTYGHSSPSRGPNLGN
ncbi:RnfABCDGE type electron transport complex subunit D [Atopomonas sediminilitoris]|uniref:RnfABCDGE type electron transport complex subunit D n=1 Tax=Atopomonas sediminilitoris TaxID=2919919 RepID=UPI001F4EB702|nr:RnfABCDGE type electron transport complex subunit D [Atopomonas sediminilitoris]MCJ8169695.1 RnfABCDGE type electron transport complex subunit D [Atopomonas sediminilitoris]